MTESRFKYATLTVGLVLLGLITWFWIVQGNPFRKPLLEREDRMVELLQSVSTAVKNEQWEAALAGAQAAEERLNKVGQKLQFAADYSELDIFRRGLTRLVAALDIKDRTEAYIIARELVTIWEGIANP